MAKTILIVDDSATTREMVTFALNNAGYGVISAVHGSDALNKLKITTVDMVITDLDMPVMDGIEFIKHLRENPDYGSMPIIILTTAPQKLERQTGEQTGADGFIVMPVSADYLVLVIKAFLRYRP